MSRHLPRLRPVRRDFGSIARQAAARQKRPGTIARRWSPAVPAPINSRTASLQRRGRLCPAVVREPIELDRLCTICGADRERHDARRFLRYDDRAPRRRQLDAGAAGRRTLKMNATAAPADSTDTSISALTDITTPSTRSTGFRSRTTSRERSKRPMPPNSWRRSRRRHQRYGRTGLAASPNPIVGVRHHHCAQHDAGRVG